MSRGFFLGWNLMANNSGWCWDDEFAKVGGSRIWFRIWSQSWTIVKWSVGCCKHCRGSLLRLLRLVGVGCSVRATEAVCLSQPWRQDRGISEQNRQGKSWTHRVYWSSAPNGHPNRPQLRFLGSDSQYHYYLYQSSSKPLGRYTLPIEGISKKVMNGETCRAAKSSHRSVFVSFFILNHWLANQQKLQSLMATPVPSSPWPPTTADPLGRTGAVCFRIGGTHGGTGKWSWYGEAGWLDHAWSRQLCQVSIDHMRSFDWTLTTGQAPRNHHFTLYCIFKKKAGDSPMAFLGSW